MPSSPLAPTAATPSPRCRSRSRRGRPIRSGCRTARASSTTSTTSTSACSRWRPSTARSCPPRLAPSFTSFHAVVGDRIFVDSILQTGGSDIGGFSFPHLNETVNFRSAGPGAGYPVPGRRQRTTFRALSALGRAGADRAGQRTAVGLWEEIRGPDLCTTRSFSTGFRLRQQRENRRTWFVGPEAAEVRVRVGADISWASRCGERSLRRKGRTESAGPSGSTRTAGSAGPWRTARTYPRCSSDGRTMFWTTPGPAPALQRCDGTGCRTLFKGDAGMLSLSPDDRRVAFLTEAESRACHPLGRDRRSGRGARGHGRRYGVQSGLVERKGSVGRVAQRPTRDLDRVRQPTRRSRRAGPAGDPRLHGHGRRSRLRPARKR